MLYDRVMRATPATPASDVVVIAIDDASIARLGAWPWPRDVHASLIDHLNSAGARVVAFTVPIDTSPRTSEAERLRAALALLESSDLGGSEQAQSLRRLLGESSAGRDPDAHLAQAMAAHGNVVLPVDVRLADGAGGKPELPARLFPAGEADALRAARPADIVAAPGPVLARAVAAVGHTQTIADGDGTVRADAAALRVGEDMMVPSLATAVAARAFGVAPADLTFGSGDALHLGDHVRPLGPQLTIRPHYFSAQPAPFKQYPYWQVMSGAIPAEQLRDKIVIIGFADSALAAPGTVTNARERRVACRADEREHRDEPDHRQGLLAARRSRSRSNGWSQSQWSHSPPSRCRSPESVSARSAAVLLIAILIVAEIGLLSSSLVWVRLVLPCLATLVGYGLFLPGELMRRATGRNEDAKNASAASLRNLGQTFQRRGSSTWRSKPTGAARWTPRRWSCCTCSATISKSGARCRRLPTSTATSRPVTLTIAICARAAHASKSNRRRAMSRRRLHRSAPRTAPELDTQPSDPDMAYPAPRHARATRTLGRYEIERELGKGAMGTVYLGRDPKINRVVAIKAIPLAEEFEENDLQEARARFFREAEMAGRLNHPSIVTVYDAGEDQGLAYIAMEYLRGTHLSTFTEAARILPFKNTMLLVARRGGRPLLCAPPKRGPPRYQTG